jgi:hypothetical protein
MQNTEQSITRPTPGMVRAGQSGGYFVHSFSTPGTWYFVYGQECSCPATVARCRHLRMVDAFCRALDEANKPARVPTNVSAMVD